MHKILSNKSIAPEVYEMRLKADTASIKAPGQFVNIKIEGFYLRRPFAICDWDRESLTILYKIVGSGTEALSRMKAREELELLYPLGNGYTLQPAKNSLIIGGNAGIAPLYGLAKALIEKGSYPKVILGFESIEDVFYEEKFMSLGLIVKVTTMDGSYGTKGMVTDVLELCDYAYVCGPEPMLKAIHNRVPDGQFSFEARMACGFGGCMGCTCQTKQGFKRICKEGPILWKEEILW